MDWILLLSSFAAGGLFVKLLDTLSQKSDRVYALVGSSIKLLTTSIYDLSRRLDDVVEMRSSPCQGTPDKTDAMFDRIIELMVTQIRANEQIIRQLTSLNGMPKVTARPGGRVGSVPLPAHSNAKLQSTTTMLRQMNQVSQLIEETFAGTSANQEDCYYGVQMHLSAKDVTSTSNTVKTAAMSECFRSSDAFCYESVAGSAEIGDTYSEEVALHDPSVSVNSGWNESIETVGVDGAAPKRPAFQPYSTAAEYAPYPCGNLPSSMHLIPMHCKELSETAIAFYVDYLPAYDWVVVRLQRKDKEPIDFTGQIKDVEPASDGRFLIRCKFSGRVYL